VLFRSRGLVGEPVAADLAAVRTALDRGAVPVVAPLGVGDAGEGPLNVNADDAAACIAAALGAAELAFLSDVPGVLGADGLPIPRVAASRPPAAAVGGMAAKLEAAGAALAGGVARVSIGGATGTQVVP
jgi:acetylglutamate kinase